MESAPTLARVVARYYLFLFFRQFMLMVGVLVPFFTEWGNLSFTQMQMVQSWFMLWIFLLEIPTGTIADRWGRKTALVIGTAITVPAVLLYGSCNHLAAFLAAEWLLACGVACISGASEALIYDWLKHHGHEHYASRVAGHGHAASMLALMIAAPLGSWVAQHWSLNLPMMLTAIPLAVATLIALSLPDAPQAQRGSATSLELVMAGGRYLWHHPRLLRMTLDKSLVQVAAYFTIWLYQPLLMKLGVAITTFGWFHTYLVCVQILIATHVAALERTCRTRRRYLTFSAAVTALAYFVTAAWLHVTTVVLFLTVAGGFGLTRRKIMVAYMNDDIPSEQRATILSVISMVEKIAIALLNPLVGWLTDQSLIWSLLCVGSFAAVAWLMSPLGRRQLDPVPSPLAHT